MSETKLPAINKPSVKHKKLFIVLGLVFILCLGLTTWSFFGDKIQGKELYAQAAGHKIYKDDVRDLIGDNENISDHDAAVVLANKYLVEALASEEGVTVSNKEIVAEYGKEIEKQKTNNKYAYQNKVNQLYFDKIATHNEGVFKGEFLVANFSRYIPYKSPLLKQDKAANPKVGDSEAIASDKKYARSLINRLYEDVNSGKITFKQAINIEKNDPIVGEDVYPTLAHSGSFDTSVESTAGFIDINYLRRSSNGGLEAGQTTKPFAVRASDSADGDSTTESYFMIVRLDEASGGGAEIGSRQYIKQAKERLEYDVYV